MPEMKFVSGGRIDGPVCRECRSDCGNKGPLCCGINVCCTICLNGTPLKRLALRFGVKELGVEEEGGNNRGRRVGMYQKAGQTTPGQPWCACFVNWCGEQAAKKMGAVSPLERVSNQALVQSYYLYAKKNGLLVPAARVQKGDMFMVWNRRLNRYAHIGFVREMNHMQGTFLTVEGNSGSTGTREGVMVCSNRRRLNPSIVFMRW